MAPIVSSSNRWQVPASRRGSAARVAPADQLKPSLKPGTSSAASSADDNGPGPGSDGPGDGGCEDGTAETVGDGTALAERLGLAVAEGEPAEEDAPSVVGESVVQPASEPAARASAEVESSAEKRAGSRRGI